MTDREEKKGSLLARWHQDILMLFIKITLLIIKGTVLRRYMLTVHIRNLQAITICMAFYNIQSPYLKICVDSSL